MLSKHVDDIERKGTENVRMHYSHIIFLSAFELNSNKTSFIHPHRLVVLESSTQIRVGIGPLFLMTCISTQTQTLMTQTHALTVFGLGSRAQAQVMFERLKIGD